MVEGAERLRAELDSGEVLFSFGDVAWSKGAPVSPRRCGKGRASVGQVSGVRARLGLRIGRRVGKVAIAPSTVGWPAWGQPSLLLSSLGRYVSLRGSMRGRGLPRSLGPREGQLPTMGHRRVERDDWGPSALLRLSVSHRHGSSGARIDGAPRVLHVHARVRIRTRSLFSIRATCYSEPSATLLGI